MKKFYTRDFDWIENVPPSSVALRNKVKNILQLSKDCKANVTSLDKTTGNFQIIFQGTLRQSKPISH